MTTYLRMPSAQLLARLRIPKALVAPDIGDWPVADMPHQHVWMEVGWSGIRSPAIPLRPEFVSRVLREFAEALGATFASSSSFPGSQVFMTVPGSPDTINVTWRECSGGENCLNRGYDWK